MANPRQGDFAKPDWEMRRASGDPPKGSTSYAKKGSGPSRADDPIVLPGSLITVARRHQDRRPGSTGHLASIANRKYEVWQPKRYEVLLGVVREG